MRLRLLFLAMAVLVSADRVAAAWPDERPPEFKFTCKEVWVPMRDGTKLAADLYLPEGSGRWPVVVERTPYSKNDCKYSQAPYFAERGYAVLIQDVRGRYRSEGEFGYYTDEGWGIRQDGYDTVEWAGTQPWSTGRASHSGSIDSIYDGALSKQPPSADEQPNALESEPRNPIQSIGGDLHVDPMGVQDHRPVDRQSLTFTTDPFPENVEVSGPSAAEFYASSTADDTDFVAILCDVRPDGYSQILRRNILRASRRESLDRPTPIEAGKIYKLRIPIYPVSNVFLRGHRLRLTISSSSFPKWLPGHNKFAENNEEAPWTHATNRIYHTAQYPSALIVPVIPEK